MRGSCWSVKSPMARAMHVLIRAPRHGSQCNLCCFFALSFASSTLFFVCPDTPKRCPYFPLTGNFLPRLATSEENYQFFQFVFDPFRHCIRYVFCRLCDPRSMSTLRTLLRNGICSFVFLLWVCNLICCLDALFASYQFWQPDPFVWQSTF